MKVVIDTNVLISGIFWQGLPFEVLKLWVNGSIEVVVTEKILEEYYRNITKIDNKKRVSEHWIAFIAENSILVEDREVIKICRDATDDVFINCAVLGNANYIISGDNDLLTLGKVMKLEIVKPADYLKLVKDKLRGV